MSSAHWRYTVNFILLWPMFPRSLTICTHALSGSITYDMTPSDDSLSDGFDCVCVPDPQNLFLGSLYMCPSCVSAKASKWWKERACLDGLWLAGP